MTDPGGERFRVKVWPLAVQAMLFAQAAAGVLVVVQVAAAAAAGRPVPWRPAAVGYAYGAAAGTLVGVPLMPLLAYTLALRVGPAGLTGPVGRWRPGTVPWDDGELTERGGVVRFGAGRRRVLVVPGWLADPDGFADAVARHAGPDHPLTRALRERPGDDA